MKVTSGPTYSDDLERENVITAALVSDSAYCPTRKGLAIARHRIHEKLRSHERLSVMWNHVGGERPFRSIFTWQNGDRGMASPRGLSAGIPFINHGPVKVRCAVDIRLSWTRQAEDL